MSNNPFEKIIEKGNQDKLGWILFVGSLIFYCLVKLPFNLSVICSSCNEGFFLVYGMYLLDGNRINFEPLFVSVFTIIEGIFGFGAASIIAVHFVQNLMVILNGILIFIITRKLLKSNFWSGFAVLAWILMLVTPIGEWKVRLEYESVFSLEAEYFCVFLSLAAIYLLILSLEKVIHSINDKWKIFSVIAGILSMTSIMFKPNGSIITLAVICWFFYGWLFNKKYIKVVTKIFLFFLIGFLSAFAFFNILICFKYEDLLSYWQFQFSLGSYSKDFLHSPRKFLEMILKFMTRGTSSVNNFILFFLAFIFFIWGLVRNIFVNEKIIPLCLFCPLLSIWGIGSVCVIIAPGIYGSYYYVLVWPLVAFFLTLGLRDLFHYVKVFNSNLVKYVTLILVLILGFGRLYVVLPGYLFLVTEQIKLNFLLQPESFQDPVKLPRASYKTNNPRRDAVLSLADFINNLLPNKQDTFFIFNFTEGHQDFSPTFYVYAKRLPPSHIFSDHLHQDIFLKKKLKILTKDFTKTPPRLIIIPKVLRMKAWQERKLASFNNWLATYINKNYSHQGSFTYLHIGLDSPETYHVFLKK